MASKKPWPLFGLTKHQLLQRCIRRRFKEEKPFGREDIDRWLKKERYAAYPDDAVWPKYLPMLERSHTDLSAPYRCYGVSITQLHEYCPQVELDTLDLADFPDEAKSVLKKIMGRERSLLYLFGDTSTVLLYRSRKPRNSVALSWRMKTGLMGVHDVSTIQIVRALYHTWKTVGERAHRVRRLLCRWLANLIREIRSLAVCQFNEAVAVSLDTTTLIPADMVVVVHQDGTINHYANGTFEANKILVHDYQTMRRQDCPDFRFREDAHKRIRAIVKVATTPQILLVSNTISENSLGLLRKDPRRVFITPAQFVPRIK